MGRILCLMLLWTVSGAWQNKPAHGQEIAKKAEAAEARSIAPLKAGDAAPALRATKWLKGKPVTTFQPGRVYVIEFWATWCGPCIRHMPHLSRLQAEYEEKGVNIIAFTCSDIRGGPDNNENSVAAFVKRRGSALGYTFAYSDEPEAADAWLKGQKSTFCTYVVDKKGRVAYIGGPMFLDLALPKVVAGDVSAEAIGDAMAKADADYQAVCKNLERDPETGLRALAEFEINYPQLADLPPIVPVKLTELRRRGTERDAKEYAEAIVAKAIKQKDTLRLELASLVLRNASESKELLTVAVKAAEARVRLDGGSESLLNLAETYLATGDKAKAKDYVRKAIAAAASEPPAYRQHIEQEARRIVGDN